MKKIAVGATANVVTLGPAGDRGNMLELTVRRSVEESREIARTATDAGGGDGSGAGIAGTAALATLSGATRLTASYRQSLPIPSPLPSLSA